MAERGLYKKGEIKSRECRDLKDTKPTKPKKHKSDHKHEYQTIVIEYDVDVPGLGKKHKASIGDICLTCGRMKDLRWFESEEVLEDGHRYWRMLSSDADSVKRRHPELPVYECDYKYGKTYLENLKEKK